METDAGDAFAEVAGRNVVSDLPDAHVLVRVPVSCLSAYPPPERLSECMCGGSSRGRRLRADSRGTLSATDLSEAGPSAFWRSIAIKRNPNY